jgi:hypothetical protein
MGDEVDDLFTPISSRGGAVGGGMMPVHAAPALPMHPTPMGMPAAGAIGYGGTVPGVPVVGSVIQQPQPPQVAPRAPNTFNTNTAYANAAPGMLRIAITSSVKPK